MSTFCSVFKINGVPILPPVMTDEVRAEVARYREKALEIERKLQIIKEERSNANCADLTSSKAEYKQEISIHDSDGGSSLVRQGSFTLEAPSPGLGVLPQSTTPVKENVVGSDNESPRPRLIRSNSYTLDSPSPLLMKHMHNQSLNIKCSTSMGEIETGTIKSHIKKLDFGGGGEMSAKKSPKPQGAKPKWVSTKKVSPKPLSPAKKYKSPYDSSAGKKKNKPVKQAEALRDVSMKKIIKPVESTPVNDCQQRIKEIQAEYERRVKELLKQQEEEQLKLQDSFRQQQEQLMKMLPTPLLDQIHTSTPLLTSPDESTIEEEATKPSFRTLNISSKDFANNNDSQSSIGHLSSSQTNVFSDASRTTLDLENSDDLYRTCENNGIMSNSAPRGDTNGNIQLNDMRSYLETLSSSLPDEELKQLSNLNSFDHSKSRQHVAATRINAHVRGYLTRRLFQTEYVQKMVQVIRDTLLFILDLHHERHMARQQVRSPADHQLKRTLLQQLTSACYQLHGVFFDTTVQQRMAIIRRDREILRHKLENRRPRTASSSVGSNVSIRSSVSSSAGSSKRQTSAYRKLQMCSLHSVNIEAETAIAEDTARVDADGHSTANGSVLNDDLVLSKPKPSNAGAATVISSGTSSTQRSSPSLDLSAAVVSRLVHQMKQAISAPQNHCQPSATNGMLRPKTTGATLAGTIATNRRAPKEPNIAKPFLY